MSGRATWCVCWFACVPPQDPPPDPTIPSPPPIGEALDCGRTSPVGGVAEGTGLFRQDLDLALYPDARCNDGSPGIFYVRRAEAPEHEHDWVFHLQGGSACSDGASCADRWCSRAQGFGMHKMSSTTAPPQGIRAGGLLSRDGRNPFAGWNQVFLYYCSSDAWLGRSIDHALIGARADGTEVPYTLSFHGADVLDAVMSTLQREHGAPSSYVFEQQSWSMPDLDDADRILFSGSSVGGLGAIFHLDRIAERHATAEVTGLLDAIYAPTHEHLDYAQSEPCLQPEAGGPCSWEARYTHEWSSTHRALLDAIPEDSCLAAHADAPWPCADGTHLLEHHLTTPFFVRMDQEDGLFSPLYAEARLLSPADFAERTAAQVAALAQLAETAEEGATLARAPGGFAPRCGDHDTLTDTRATFEVRIGDDRRDNTIDVLSRWMNGDAPAIVVADGDGLCP